MNISPRINTPGTLCENVQLADGVFAQVYLAWGKWVGVVVRKDGQQDRPVYAATRAELLSMVEVEEQ